MRADFVLTSCLCFVLGGTAQKITEPYTPCGTLMTVETATIVEFDQVVRENRLRVYRAACYLLDDAAEAEDITQAVFVAAWRGWHRFEQRSEPYTWLYRILQRACSRHRRSRWWREHRLTLRRIAVPEGIQSVADDQPDPGVLLQRADDCQEVQSVMRGMSPKLRAVLVLRYSEDLSLEEIAAILEVPLGTVKSRLNLAQQVVAERLRKRGLA